MKRMVSSILTDYRLDALLVVAVGLCLSAAVIFFVRMVRRHKLRLRVAMPAAGFGVSAAAALALPAYLLLFRSPSVSIAEDLIINMPIIALWAFCLVVICCRPQKAARLAWAYLGLTAAVSWPVYLFTADVPCTSFDYIHISQLLSFMLGVNGILASMLWLARRHRQGEPLTEPIAGLCISIAMALSPICYFTYYRLWLDWEGFLPLAVSFFALPLVGWCGWMLCRPQKTIWLALECIGLTAGVLRISSFFLRFFEKAAVAASAPLLIAGGAAFVAAVCTVFLFVKQSHNESNAERKKSCLPIVAALELAVLLLVCASYDDYWDYWVPKPNSGYTDSETKPYDDIYDFVYDKDDCFTPEEASTEFVPPAEIQVGDIVTLADDAVYADGGAIPAWVKNQRWVVSSVSGNRAMIDQNELGTVSINSPVSTEFLTVLDDNSNGNTAAAHAAQEDISQTFESRVLRDLVCEALGKEQGSPFTAEECLRVTKIESVPPSDVSSLAGIEYLLNLQELDIHWRHSFRSADLSKNTRLESVKLSINEITSVDLSSLVNLKELDLSHNSLTELDISDLVNLERLDVQHNLLKQLDVTHNKKLKFLLTEGNAFEGEDAVKGLDALPLLETPRPGVLTVTQMPTKKYISSLGEPSLKGLKFTLSSGSFTRSVRYNDLKPLGKQGYYLYERSNPGYIWDFSVDLSHNFLLEVSYGVLTEQGFDAFGSGGWKRLYTGSVHLELDEESVVQVQKAKELKPGKAKTAFVTSTRYHNIFNSMFGNPLFRFTAPEAGEYRIDAFDIPERRNLGVYLLHDNGTDGHDNDEFARNRDYYGDGHIFDYISTHDEQTVSYSIRLEKGETIYMNPSASGDEVCEYFWWNIRMPKLAPPFRFRIKMALVTEGGS